MKEKVTYVRQLLVFGGGKILIYVSLKIRRNTMSIVYYSDENLLIRSMEIDDAKIIYETYLSYGWNPSMQTYQEYYKEQKENKVRKKRSCGWKIKATGSFCVFCC